MISRFREFLGEARFIALLVLLAVTGILSFVIGFLDTSNSAVIQLTLALVFVIGAAVIIGGKMSNDERQKWAAIIAPAFGLVILGVFFLPQFVLAFLGAAVGWVLVSLLVFGRARAPMEYRVAIKHMRKSEYKEAVEVMSDLIKSEPDQPNHYRFRAELLRLWGKLGRAKRDYEKMTEIAPDSAVAFNGLAEVHLQAGDYEPALAAAQKAYELAPDEWVAPYNLGMIEDRMGLAGDAVKSLAEASNLKVPDARHRLLIYFYLARAYSRLNQLDNAQDALESVKAQKAGLDEWQQILESEQAETLRMVLAKDIETAKSLISGDIDVTQLGETTG